MVTLNIQPLQREHFHIVAEWEHGPQIAADWARYVAEMERPQWIHLGLYLDKQCAGCVSFEKVAPTVARIHVTTRRRAFHPNYLAWLLRQTAKVIFEGVEVIEAVIPEGRRAAARLAIRCGMRREDVFPWERRFVMTRGEFDSNELP
jgi:hypothetical protein